MVVVDNWHLGIIGVGGRESKIDFFVVCDLGYDEGLWGLEGMKSLFIQKSTSLWPAQGHNEGSIFVERS